MNSEYKRIKGARKYFVTADGFIFKKVGDYNFKPLSLSKTNQAGYMGVNIQLNNGTWVVKTVHSLVAEAFVPKPKWGRKLEVNHKDGDKENNHYSNLEWLSHKANMEAGWKSGAFDKISKAISDKRKKLNGLQTNLTESDVRQIRHLRREGLSNREVGHIFQLHPMQISRIYNRRSFANVN
jgi:hypothetical protein